MLEFKIPKIEDREWVQPILTAAEGMGNEFAFGTLFLWSEAYSCRICRHGDFIFVCYNYGSGEDLYTYPIGRGDLREALELLEKDAQERNVPFRLWGLSREDCEELEGEVPGRFQYQPFRDDFDYIYRTQDLIQLAGRKYHGKRNHLSQFSRNFSWSYEDISPENFEDVRAVALEWARQNDPETAGGLTQENGAIFKALEYFAPLKLSGGLIRVEGKPAAFTIGEEINPCCFVLHFEKALEGYLGLYTVINHEFASRNLSQYEYVNREEDMGIEGIRKAKLSYRPALLLEKYVASPKRAL